jgi:hypothetical protein
MMRALSVIAGVMLAIVLSLDEPAPDRAPREVATAEGFTAARGPHRRKRRPKRAKAPVPPAPGDRAGSGSAAPAGPAAPAPAGPDERVVEPTPDPPAVAPASPPPTPTPPTPAPTIPTPAATAARVDVAPAKSTRSASAHGGFVADMDCSACHSPEGWKLSSTAGKSGFDHDRTGFPLRGAHTQRVCTECHTGVAQLPTTCEGCHRDPHQGRMDGACAECHQATAWADTSALDLHRRTRMPLTGRHAVLECTACHTRQSERTWSDVPSECYACHKADYQRADVHPDHDGDPADPSVQPFPRDCGRCHRTASWSGAVIVPTARGAFAAAARIEHDAWFVLSTGPHVTADCTSCHPDRRRTRLARCDGCHTADSIASQHPGRTVSRVARSCLRCHPRGAAR